MKLSLNADVGEGFGRYELGNDAALMPLITAANVACGMHAGDPTIMAETVRLAKQHSVSIGAHPGFNDIWGFGRRPITMDFQDIEYLVSYQIGAFQGIAISEDLPVRHVKPHGALNNIAERDHDVAYAIARGIRAVDRDLIFVANAGSVMIHAGHQAGLQVVSEFYADRTYDDDGRILPRSMPDATHASPDKAAEQIKYLVECGSVRTRNGQLIPIQAETICIHSDAPEAPKIAQAVRRALTNLVVNV